MDFLSKLQGYRTYIVAIVAAILGAVQFTYPEFVMPDWATWVMSALGLSALRASVPPK